jgi:hypothetical protein
MAKIYLSSTYADLKEFREAVYRALRQMQEDVIAMEDYVASDQRPLDKCLADVDECEAYVGLFAWRYGYIPQEGNPRRLSITEREYRRAKARGKPRFIFLLHKDADWPQEMRDSHTGEGEAGLCIQNLRNELARVRTVSFFKTPAEVAGLVSVAIHNWRERQKTLIQNPRQTRQERWQERKRIILRLLSPHYGGVEIQSLKQQAGRQGVPEKEFNELVEEMINIDHFMNEVISNSEDRKYITRRGKDYLSDSYNQRK